MRSARGIRRAGFTLDSTGKTYVQGSAGTRVRSDARRTIDRIAAEFENGGLGTLLPNPVGVAATDLVFQSATGVNVADNSITFGPSTRLQILYETGEANNGLDDDGDGLVDEGRVVLTRNYLQAGEISITLVRGVAEYLEDEVAGGGDENGNGFVDERGFCMTLQGSLLFLRLTLQRPVGEARTVVGTVETAVRLKN
jgi:hypothetical protein